MTRLRASWIWDRRSVAGLAAAALMATAASTAYAGIGRHSTWYQSFGPDGIEVAYNRATQIAEVLSNHMPCLSSNPRHQHFDMYPLSVRRGRVRYSGWTHGYPSTSDSIRRKIRINLVLHPHKAVGTVTFPGTKCGTVHISARAVRITH